MMMNCPVLVILWIASLTTQYVQSDNICGHAELSKYVDGFAELQEAVGSLRTDLLQTRNLLAQALLRLASPVDVDKTDSDDHDIIKRSALDESPGDHDESPADVDDLLSGLSLQSLLPLLGTRCKDGRDGAAGKDGKDGINGRDGRDGISVNGVNGKDGRDGLDGGPGLKGEPGPPGNSTEGEPGQPGVQGPKGQTGARGLTGPAGPTGERGLKGSTGLRGSPGSAAQTRSLYTRWGRTSCAGGSSLIYQGFAAGTYYSNKGGGVNYQCMPLIPEYNSYSSRGTSSVLSGVEYESGNIGVFPTNVYQQNVPCARCLSPRSAVMMYPAKRNCPTGWSKEYEGYLMTGHTSEQASTFECVDQSPEYISGQSANTNGANLFFIKPDCSGAGTIGDCSYYSSSKQLTCVVCTK